MSDSMVLKNYQVVFTNYSTCQSRTIRTTAYDVKRLWERYPTASGIYCDGPVSEEEAEEEPEWHFCCECEERFNCPDSERYDGCEGGLH